jgi:hypothetical protein
MDGFNAGGIIGKFIRLITTNLILLLNLGMLPIHSCMTSCVSRYMYSTDGQKHGNLLGEIEDYPAL